MVWPLAPTGAFVGAPDAAIGSIRPTMGNGDPVFTVPEGCCPHDTFRSATGGMRMTRNAKSRPAMIAKRPFANHAF